MQRLTRAGHLRLTVASAAMLAGLHALPVAAQDTTPFDLGTLVLTGERTERSVYDTASSVEVLTGEDIEREGPEADLQDALRGIANVTDLGQDSSVPAIRGVDSGGPLRGVNGFVGGALPRATVVVDGRPISNFEYTQGSTSVFDLERLEVFRGPQTTAQGVNSIAGAFQLVTKDPTFEPEARLQFLLGSDNLRQFGAVVSGPLIENELAYRLSFDTAESDSFLDFSGQLPGLGFDPDEFSRSNLRFKLLWEPAEIPGLSTKLTLGRTQSEEPERTRARAPFPYALSERQRRCLAQKPAWQLKS